MTRFSRACLPIALGFVVFTLDSLWNFIDPTHPSTATGPIATANAATACGVPSIEALAREWTVQSVACDGECAVAHVAKGDKFTFSRAYGDKPSFSLQVRPTDAARTGARTEGATLGSDGIGNVRGPIVLGHNLLDGSPLQLHWIIVQLRAYDLTGTGDCALRARVAVCDAEPAANAASCSTKQHNGMIHLGG
jgi:hypothetical protein